MNNVLKPPKFKYWYLVKGNKIYTSKLGSRLNLEVLKFKNATKAKKFWEKFAAKNIVYLLPNGKYLGFARPVKD